MDKRIRSTIISLCIIIVLIVAVLIGAKKGVFSKLAGELPTLEAKDTKKTAQQEDTTEAAKDYSGMSEEEIEMEKMINYYMKPSERKKLDPGKPFGGYDVVKLGEEFKLSFKGVFASKDDKKENDKYYKVRVKSFKISRECDFDINNINYGLESRKEYLDENNNFISDLYYGTAEIEFTNVNDSENMEMTSVWGVFSMNDDGTYYARGIGTGGDSIRPLGGISDNSHGLTNIKPGETQTQILYYVFTDKSVTESRLAMCFGSPAETAFNGPWVIVHEPADN